MSHNREKLTRRGKKPNFVITPAQIEAIKTLADEVSSMIGVGTESDVTYTKCVKHIDRMLKNNGHTRQFD